MTFEGAEDRQDGYMDMESVDGELAQVYDGLRPLDGTSFLPTTDVAHLQNSPQQREAAVPGNDRLFSVEQFESVDTAALHAPAQELAAFTEAQMARHASFVDICPKNGKYVDELALECVTPDGVAYVRHSEEQQLQVMLVPSGGTGGGCYEYRADDTGNIRRYGLNSPYQMGVEAGERALPVVPRRLSATEQLGSTSFGAVAEDDQGVSVSTEEYTHITSLIAGARPPVVTYEELLTSVVDNFGTGRKPYSSYPEFAGSNDFLHVLAFDNGIRYTLARSDEVYHEQHTFYTNTRELSYACIPDPARATSIRVVVKRHVVSGNNPLYANATSTLNIDFWQPPEYLPDGRLTPRDEAAMGLDPSVPFGYPDINIELQTATSAVQGAQGLTAAVRWRDGHTPSEHEKIAVRLDGLTARLARNAMANPHALIP